MPPAPERWLAQRLRSIEVSGIRKVFELGRSLTDPIDLSIGQPHFDVPASVKAAAHAAIDAGRNGYTVTQGVAPLLDRVGRLVPERLRGPGRQVMVTSGTSGALVLSLLATVDPGDEVILFDPYFVGYPHMVRLAGGVPVFVDTYDTQFGIDPDRLRAALTPRTKAILLNSPANPTGAVLPRDVIKAVADLAAKHGVLLVSDEVYRAFSGDEPFVSPLEYNEDVLVVDGFSKAWAMTGWRLGWAHGPAALVREMIKLQQFTYVCAPQPVQLAGLAALDHDVAGYAADYRRKRDRLREGLADLYELPPPGGAFYLFPKAPWGGGSEFVEAGIRHNLLSIPGSVFSRRDTHFRLSYAADDRTLDRAVEVLRKLAKRP